MMIRRLIAVLFCLLLGTALAQLEPRGPIVSLAQFQSQLDQLNSQVADLAAFPQRAEALRKSLPPYWTVIGGRLPVDVSTKFLDQALTDFQVQGAAQKELILKELHTQLTVMRAAADSYTQPERTDAAMRKRLDEILAAREFSSVHGPSLFQQWMDRIADWLRRWWDKLFGAMNLTPPDFTWVGRIFVWLVIAAGASVLGVWLYRIYRRKPVEYQREIIPFAPSARSWRLWLQDARTHAARGDWRNAIHLAYWAGVSYLEASGSWTPDRARTPREYLKEVDVRDPKKPTFTSLTRRFENVWYGSHAANASDFDQTLSELEKLGCQ